MRNIFLSTIELNVDRKKNILFLLIINFISSVVLGIAPALLIHQGALFIEYASVTNLIYMGIILGCALIMLPLHLWTSSLSNSLIESNRISLLNDLDENINSKSYDDIEKDIDSGLLKKVSFGLSYGRKGYSKFSSILFKMPGYFLLLLIYIFILGSLNLFLGLLVLALIIGLMYFYNLASSEISKFENENDKIMEVSSEIFNSTTDTDFMREMRINNTGSIVNDRYIDLSLDYEDREGKIFKYKASGGFFAASILTLGAIILIFLFTHSYALLGPSSVVLYGATYLSTIIVVSIFFKEFIDLVVLKDVMKSLISFLEDKNEISDNNIIKKGKNNIGKENKIKKDKNKKEHEASTSKPGFIKIDDLTFSYEGEEPILRNLDLTIQPGETISIAGVGGTGKTALINCIVGLYKNYSGTITVDRNEIALISDSSEFMPFTLGENLSGEKDFNEERLYEVIKKSKIHDILDSKGIRRNLKGVYSTNLFQDDGKEFTIEEKLKILYARLLYLDKSIIIIDEAGRQVEVDEEKELTELILKERKLGTTVIITTERPEIMALTDRVLLLHDGYIAEEGSYVAMKEKGDIFREDFKFKRGANHE